MSGILLLPPAAPQANTGSGSNNAGIIVPTVLAVVLVLAFVIIAGLAVFVCKKRKRSPPFEPDAVRYTTNKAAGHGPLHNPMYMGTDALLAINSTNGSVASDLHFDPSGDYGQYETIPNEREVALRDNSPLAGSTEDLLETKEDLSVDPPHYSTIAF